MLNWYRRSGWFSCQRLSILHPSYRRVCGGGR